MLATVATSLLLVKSEGMLEPYAPKGTESLDPRFVEADHDWVGTNAWAAALCVNTVESEKATGAGWADLIKPVYKGMIVMPNPASSGTGFLDVSSWLQRMGEEKGWQYMDALHQNIATYAHFGSKPCTLVRGNIQLVFRLSFEPCA